MTIITLSSDFGADGYFVGVMHGVIASLAPIARIIDLCHTIRPYGRLQAARLISANYHYFPAGSIHVIVVDPGVGSERNVILLEADGHYFLAPDNGILSQIAAKPKSRVWVIDRPELYLKPLSQTFHGRDIFAPLAAHLALGETPKNMASQVNLEDLIRLDAPQPQLDYESQQISGAVIDIDHFGNIITNISRQLVRTFFADTADRAMIIDINGRQLQGIASYYNEKAVGLAVALYNSEDLLEIAINQGRACDFLQVKSDTRIIIRAEVSS